MNSGIYTISFPGTDNFYVGKTSNFRNRKRFHLWQLRRGVHSNPKMQNCFHKYGDPQFCLVEVIESKDTMTEREQAWLDEHADSPILLNICKVSVVTTTYRKTESNKRIAWNKGLPSARCSHQHWKELRKRVRRHDHRIVSRNRRL